MPSVTYSGMNTNIVDVSYPVREAQQVITRAEYDLINSFANDVQGKIKCIKFMRTQYELGLYEAKKLVDTICEQPTL